MQSYIFFRLQKKPCSFVSIYKLVYKFLKISLLVAVIKLIRLRLTQIQK